MPTTSAASSVSRNVIKNEENICRYSNNIRRTYTSQVLVLKGMISQLGRAGMTHGELAGLAYISPAF